VLLRLCDFLLSSPQARSDFAENFIVVSGGGSFHMNASAFDARFFHQSLEVKLQKIFYLLPRQECDGNIRGLASRFRSSQNKDTQAVVLPHSCKNTSIRVTKESQRIFAS